MPNRHALAQAETIKHTALTELAVAKRERLKAEDYEVYLNALEGFTADAVREGCRRLARAPKAEFAPNFPTLDIVVEACAAVAKENRIREDQKRLSAHVPDPVPEEKLAEFMQQIRLRIGKAKMS